MESKLAVPCSTKYCKSNESLTRNGNQLLRYPFSTFNQLIIDTELKAWKKRSNSKESVYFDSVYFDHGSIGRGNNWMHGFYGVDEKIDDILDSYRKMVEGCYRYNGVYLVHSLAGGTGSGLGSRLVQELRDEYSKGAIITSSIAPFISGETAVQNYNSLLTINVLQEHADLIGIFPNDDLLHCASRNSTMDHKKITNGNSIS